MLDDAKATVALLILLLVAATAGCEGPSGYDGPVRHVVVLSLDTTRADHFGFYGNTDVKTPRLDSLAGESIVFDDFMTVVPTTLASHASLFSGKYPHTHGTPRNGFTVNDENVIVMHTQGRNLTQIPLANFPPERTAIYVNEGWTYR